MRRGAYYTHTTQVVENPPNYQHSKLVGFDSLKFKLLLENGETFQYHRTFKNTTKKYHFEPNTITVVLTCSVDSAMSRRRGKNYYYAHWRDNRDYDKKLKRAYVGKAENITLEKLKSIAEKFFNG